ncbi:hypothetical protein ACFQ1L_29590 [Phytohabitans flavus]|uniref:hypothetical protein n=1 Tax=Phytohabitans flavus TaxID=1076124 RepID=UPI001563D3F2|nr:hypothetical protein [Phytohabitans flavus]
MAVLLAVLVAAAGCGSDASDPPAPDSSPKESATVEPVPTTDLTALVCGATFTPPTGGGLYLSGRFPASTPASGPAVTGAVEVNSPRAVSGVVAPSAEVFLVRDGRIATVPLPQDTAGKKLDLKPSQPHELPGDAALVSCAAGGEPLAPGTYQMYARVVFTPDSGTPVESFGGPWPIDVT